MILIVLIIPVIRGLPHVFLSEQQVFLLPYTLVTIYHQSF